jgi:hypothetical protein
MIQISYLSAATHPMSTEEVLKLLRQCLANNSAKDITGLLIYSNETFLQTLEGDEQVVDDLYRTIEKDLRHANLIFLGRKTIERRQYAEWSMGFRRVSDLELQDVEGLKDFSAKDFTVEFLSQHTDLAENLMAHYAYWDPLVRKVEEHEQTLKTLKKTLERTRGYVEVATLVLESVVDASRLGSLSDVHLRLCQSTLETLRQSN